MTTLNSNINYSNLSKIKLRHKHTENKISSEFNTKRQKFVTLLENYNATQDLSLLDEIIISGRHLSDFYLTIYLHTSDTNALFRILDIHKVIFPLYYSDGLVDGLFFVKDKCKYFANQILVLFFLNRMNDVRKELIAYKHYIEKFKRCLKIDFFDIYVKMYNLFKSANKISILDNEKQVVDIDTRLSYDLSEISDFKLQRAVIVGSCATQVCYRGYTIDMLRISQCIEHEGPQREKMTLRKWTFYNHSVLDVLEGINDATSKMSKHGIFLLYISADEYEFRRPRSASSNPVTNSKFDVLVKKALKMKQLADESIEHSREECLLPLDVVSFLTGPSLLVIESQSSHEFNIVSDYLSTPTLCLLSPMKYPDFIDRSDSSKLFTLFLTCPLKAFCWICERYIVDYNQVWIKIKTLFDQFMATLVKELRPYFDRDSQLRLFMGDSATRALFLRHLFCNISLRLHCAFPVDGYLPKCNYSEIESAVVHNGKLHDIVYEMADALDALNRFVVTSTVVRNQLHSSIDSIKETCL